MPKSGIYLIWFSYCVFSAKSGRITVPNDAMRIKKTLSLLLLSAQALYIFAFALPCVSMASQENRTVCAPVVQVFSCAGLVNIAIVNTVDSLRALAEISGLIKTTHKKEAPKKEAQKQDTPATLSNLTKLTIDFKNNSNQPASVFNGIAQKTINYSSILSVVLSWLFLSGVFLSLYRMKINYVKVKDAIDHISLFKFANIALI